MKPTALLSLPGADELELLPELDALAEDLSLLLPHAAATRARRRTADMAAQREVRRTTIGPFGGGLVSGCGWWTWISWRWTSRRPSAGLRAPRPLASCRAG